MATASARTQSGAATCALLCLILACGPAPSRAAAPAAPTAVPGPGGLGCFPLLPSGTNAGTVQDDSKDPAVENRTQAAFAQSLQDGADVYQLGITWDAVEPTKGQLNTSFVTSAVAMLGEMKQSVLLNVGAVNTAVFSMPADLVDPTSNGTKLRAGLTFSSDEVLSRYAAVLDALATALQSRTVVFFGVGNEVAGPLVAVPAYSASFKTFVSSSCSHLHGLGAVASQVTCGFSAQFSSLSALHGTGWWTDTVNAADNVAITYYPLKAGFVVEDPGVVPGDIATMLSLTPADRCVAIQEAGYPSGYANASKSTNNSTQAKQRDFFANLFKAVAAQPRVRAVSAFKLVDWTQDVCAYFEKYYHFASPAFAEYLCTLGMLDEQGFPKLAFDAFLAGLTQLKHGALPRGAADSTSSAVSARGKLSFSSATHPEAALFSRQVQNSMAGVMQHTFVANDTYVPSINATLPAGYVSASLPGKPWSYSMWPRDGTGFLREAIASGDMDTAKLSASAYLRLVTEDPATGFYSLPEHYDGLTPSGSLTAEDGTAGLVTSMVDLWRRLPDTDPMAAEVSAFVLSPKSPVAYWRSLIAAGKPGLVPGTGEFGGGAGLSATVFNVVQNSEVSGALLAAAVLARESGDAGEAAAMEADAASLRAAMLRHLRNTTDGGWMWAINTTTLTPTPAITQDVYNIGFAGINMAQTSLADGAAGEWAPAAASAWPEGFAAGMAAFKRLASTPLRAALFREFGMFAQFDVVNQFPGVAGSLPGHATSAYGQDYATHLMLLTDNLRDAGAAIGFLANTTALGGQTLSADYFYERMEAPPLKAMAQVGCGELNLVGVVAPAKTARLVLGVHDKDPAECVVLLPRLPPGWDSAEATDWPVLCDTRRVLRVNLTARGAGVPAQATDGGVGSVDLTVLPSATSVSQGGAVTPIPRLCIRLGSAKAGFVWRNYSDVTSVHATFAGDQHTETSDDVTAPQTDDVTVHVNASKASSVVTSERFLSYTMDHGFMTGEVNFSDPGLLFMAQQLAPAYVRVGGTDSDFPNYSFPSGAGGGRDSRAVRGGGEQPAALNGAAWSQPVPPAIATLNASVWDALVEFTRASGQRLVFGLSALASARNADGSWNGDNAATLMRHAASTPGQADVIEGFELSNEPDLYTKHHNYTVTPAQLAADFGAMRALVDRELPGSGVLGCDVAGDVDYMAQWVQAGGASHTSIAVTYHFYYGSGRELGVNDTHNVQVLDKLLARMDADANATRSADRRLWLGETASFYGGGSPNASDRYCTGFMWLDKLGQAAARAYGAVARQSFNGGSYALVNEHTGVPNPDWWTAVVHKRLVGPTVLSVAGAMVSGRHVRVYAQCAVSGGPYYDIPRGSVVLIVVNVNDPDTAALDAATPATPTGAATLTLTGSLAGLDTPRLEFALGPGDAGAGYMGLSSPTIALNGGAPLALRRTGNATAPLALPPLPPRAVPAGGAPITVGALRYGLYVLTAAKAEACM